MAKSATRFRKGRELLKEMRSSVARFYPCDFHVHTPGSYDVCQPKHFASLPEQLSEALRTTATGIASQLPLANIPADVAAFDDKISTPALVEAFLSQLVDRRNQLSRQEGLSDTDNWSIVGITDHNTSHFSCRLADSAWHSRNEHRILVLPGIELDVLFDVPAYPDKCQVHILCLFAPLTTPSDIRIAINESRSAGTIVWEFGRPLEVSNLAEFVGRLRSHGSYPACCIAAHVWSKKGVQNEPTKLIFAHLDTEIARFEGELSRARQDGSSLDVSDLERRLTTIKDRRMNEHSIHLDVLRLIGNCGFDGLQVRDQSHETHYRRLHRFREQHGRGVPVVCSDAHTPTSVFSSGTGVPFAKVSPQILRSDSPRDVFCEIRDKVLRFGETRTTYKAPGSVTHWIEGLEIVRDADNASHFWNIAPDRGAGEGTFTLELSRNLTCFVGGRGSGKSAGIEAIAFLADPDRFSAEGKKRKDISDWYLRAKATLSGCRVRLVWKSTAETGIGALPKKALFVSRYFDPDGAHQAVEMRDADDNAIVDSTVCLPSVRILRVHEIEDTARNENLRRLFDDLCGPRVNELTAEIVRLQLALVDQRKLISQTAEELARLTADSSPLRQYGIRKMQFDLVNKPDLQSRFEQIDMAEEASRFVTGTVESWEELHVEKQISEIAHNVTSYFQSASEALPCREKEVVESCLPLLDLLRTDANEVSQEDAAENNSSETEGSSLVSALRVTGESARTFSHKLGTIKSAIHDAHVEQSNALAREGLPVGSSERAAKKRAYDEAKESLIGYESASSRFQKLIEERRVLHENLIDACKQRTQLRESTASSITSLLARDLDASILQIQLLARPMQDQSELEKWLSINAGPSIKQYRDPRIKAILNAKTMPAVLRELFLSESEPDLAVLNNRHSKAEDGKIDNDLATQIFSRCRACRRVTLNESETWPAGFRETLPESIQDGVVTFFRSADGNELCVTRVLELDEVVLNDTAEVRLNDRPSDAESEPRPLEELSPGQRCSAILPILLLSGDYPLIIDQPEENLDNRLIRQVIVNILASMKLRRQVIIATHNPNLPVLGDAEQCVVMQAQGRSQSQVVATGNLDSPEVARYVTDIMEGGREAFQYRQSIYQHHWKGAVESDG